MFTYGDKPNIKIKQYMNNFANTAKINTCKKN